jgi:SpoU rRNA methylase family enzyme
MKGIQKYTVSFLLLFFLTAMTVHKFYVSTYQVNYVSQKKMLQITSRIFIDDLNEALEKKYKKKAFVGTNRQTEADIDLMKKYIAEKCLIKVNGEQKSFTYLSNEIEANVLVCYFSIKDISKLNTLSIENSALMELYGDQQNVIQANIDGDKKSLLLTVDNFKGILK